MSYNNFLKNNNLIVKFIFLFLTFSLFLGFYLNENSTGGAEQDYLVHDQISELFFNDFNNTLQNYDSLKTRHSPIIPIYFSFLKFFNFDDNLVRFIHLPISLLIVFIFFKCLEIKYSNYNRNNLIIFSSILLLSPTIRSLSIWPDSHLYGLLFFLVATYFFLIFLKAKEKKKVKYALLNILFLAISSYIRPSFSLFAIYFFWFFYKEFKFTKKLIQVIVFNLILALPAIYYLFYLDIMFLKTNAVSNIDFFTRINPANKILLISSIVFFHIFPIIYFKFDHIKKKFFQIRLYEHVSLFLIFILCLIYFNYKKDFSGGGIFFHISNLLNLEFIFFVISLISIYILYSLTRVNLNNFLIVILIFFSNPQLTIYHKYYDPLILIIFFLLINISLDKKIFNFKSILFFYSHSFLFLLLSLLK
tara:strand:- start:3190 stop:4443 length:1254 start_codon:yes stop_codon:yes gene_type:complete